MKVTVMARIRQDGKQPFVKPVWQGTRLKAGVVIVNGIETKRDDVSYYLRYTGQGKQRTEPAGPDANDVLTFQKRIQATLEAEANGLAVSGGQIVSMPQISPEGRRTTIQTAIDQYLDDLRLAKRPPATIADKQNHLTAFTTLIHKMYLDEYSRGDVLRFKDHLEGQDYAPKTVENFMMSVVVFFNEQKIDLEMRKSDWPVYQDNPPEPYQADEVNRLLAAADYRMRLIIRMFVGTGMRDMELAHLTWEDIDFVKKVIHVRPKPCQCRNCATVGQWKPKNRTSRTIPVSDGLLKDLQPGTGLVFPSPRDGRLDGKLLAKLKAIATKAGVENAKLHRFRDTFITNKIRDGVDLRTVQNWAGGADWANPDGTKTTKRFRSELAKHTC